MDPISPIDRLSGASIRARLARRDCPDDPVDELAGCPPGPLERAAVLLPLYRLEDAWHLVFIRRAERARDRHSGQVGFPGGRWQSGDPDDAATALREAEEEIGLPRAEVSLLGTLRPLCTLSRFLVTPVVGAFAWPQPLKPDPGEVARIFSIPLAWLASPGRYRVDIYPAPGHPQARDVHFFEEYGGELLWGVSARILIDLLACLSGGPRGSRGDPTHGQGTPPS